MSDEETTVVNPRTSRPKKRGWRDAEGPIGGNVLSTAVPASRRQIGFVGFLLITSFAFLVYLLFKAWPPTPWPTDLVDGVRINRSHDLITFFARFTSLSFDVHTSLDERLIFLVIVAGALGSYIHAATSFADYVGNRKFTESWLWWYVLRPFIGVALALVSYFVVRAGFLTGGAGDVNPYGVATLGALAGMFSKQATDKLEEVFTTIFRPAPGKGDAKRGDKLGAPTVSGMAPREGPSAGGTEVTISGTGYVDKPSVTFNGKPVASVAFTNATTIKVITPPHEPGAVEVVVTNPDGQEGSPKETFTYIPDEVPGAPVVSNNDGEVAENSDAAVDKLDGHEAVEADTADKALPITKRDVE